MHSGGLYFIVVADLAVSCCIYFTNFKTHFFKFFYFKYFNSSCAEVGIRGIVRARSIREVFIHHLQINILQNP